MISIIDMGPFPTPLFGLGLLVFVLIPWAITAIVWKWPPIGGVLLVIAGLTVLAVPGLILGMQGEVHLVPVLAFLFPLTAGVLLLKEWNDGRKARI